MTIELNELVIRTSVSNQNQTQSQPSGGQAFIPGETQETIVSACVREVLKQLQEEEQR